jgi:hypothetical protein
MNMQRFSMKMMTLTLALAFAMATLVLTGSPVIARDMLRPTAHSADAIGHATSPPLMLAKSLMESGSNQGFQGTGWDQSAGQGQGKSANSVVDKEPALPHGQEWIRDYFRSGEARDPFLRK